MVLRDLELDRTFGGLSGCPILVVIARTFCPHREIGECDDFGEEAVYSKLVGLQDFWLCSGGVVL